MSSFAAGRTIAIIEARMTSSRLPGKTLAPILGRPMLGLMIERLQRCDALDGIVVATTVNATDDPICDLARRLGVGHFRGSEDDVLDRVLNAAWNSDADVIVELTADCPLIDPGVVDRVVGAYRERDVDFAANTLVQTYPRGLDTKAFATSVLADVAARTNDPVDHEHVSLYIYEHPELYSLWNVDSGLPEWCGALRLTVDTADDLRLIRAIYEELYPRNPVFDLDDVLELLDGNPMLAAINCHVRQKAVR